MAKTDWDHIATIEYVTMDRVAQRQWADLRERVSRRSL